MIYEEVLRPLLFLLSPDGAHEISMKAFERKRLWRLLSPAFRYGDERLRCRVLGLDLDSPVGLSAGYDKDAKMTPALADLGFGFVTIGSVMGRAYPGNGWPRLVRKEEEFALVNAMGLNSQGVEVVAGRAAKWKAIRPLIGSIAGYTVEECLRVIQQLQPYVDAIEVNTSSPTFKGSWSQSPDRVEDLLRRVKGSSRRPTLVKIPPYADEEGRNGALNIVEVCQKMGFGVTAANSRPVAEPGLSAGYGGVSGRALLDSTKRIVRDISVEMGGKTPVIACGGIFTGRDAFELIGLGADACEVLTSFVYRGPSTAKLIKMELMEEMKRNGFRSVEELKGALLAK
jgi:dihydroorotate dehydrogenase